VRPIGPALLAPTAQLCQFVLEHLALHFVDLEQAWHAAHGHRFPDGSAHPRRWPWPSVMP